MASNELINKDMTRFAPGTVTVLGPESTKLTLVRDYAAAPERVWAMLTDPALTASWWCKVRGSARTGSSFDLKWLNLKDEGQGIESDWWNGRVLAADAPHLLRLSNAMHGTLEATLTPHDGGTRLEFSNVLDLPAETAVLSLTGWHVHLDHLQEALAGKAIDWVRWWPDFYPSFEAVHAAYLRAAVDM